MTFSKAFPRNVEGSNYPRWEETKLSDEEEKEIEQQARLDNIKIMKECIDDAKQLIEEKGYKEDNLFR